MDGIESTGTLPIPASASALQHMAQIALRQRTASVTTEEVAGSSDEKKRQLAKDFEAVLLTKLFDQVKESIGNSGFDDDVASDQIHGLFWSYLAQDVADKGGFGLWRDIYEHFQDIEGRQTTGGLIDKEL
jgi:Rod binding domain-containing protein